MEAVDLAAKAWGWAESGHREPAYDMYAAANAVFDAQGKPGLFLPDLEILRHFPGEANGIVTPPEFDEDAVPGFWFHGPPESEDEDLVLSDRTIPFAPHTQPTVYRDFTPEWHGALSKGSDAPHVQVLSAGRSGTVALYDMLQGSDVVPYHAFWWNPSPQDMWEHAHSRLAFDFNAASSMGFVKCRAAEWLGCETQGRIFVDLNHKDTAFAPIFAALHPNAKFVYLHRGPVEIFRSYWTKDQWKGAQLRPLYVGFDPFRYRFTEDDEITCIAWLVAFTERFSRSMVEATGGIEIEFNDLIGGDVECLMDFIGAEGWTPPRHMNRKSHKTVRKMTGRDRDAFLGAYRRFAE